MALDHEAILKAYPNATVVDDSVGVLDANENQISIDQTLVDAARVELDKEFYKIQRRREYPDWGTQLDYIYHNGIEKWKTDIVDPVKDKYPKPS
tara:strand:+ start:975 stop:1256 length:282 start_codon:yes stop_codon:yes gene_type:complete